MIRTLTIGGLTVLVSHAIADTARDEDPGATAPELRSQPRTPRARDDDSFDMDSVESRTRHAAIYWEDCLVGLEASDPEEALDEEFLAEARDFIRRMLDRGRLHDPDDWADVLPTMVSVEEFRRHWGTATQESRHGGPR